MISFSTSSNTIKLCVPIHQMLFKWHDKMDHARRENTTMTTIHTTFMRIWNKRMQTNYCTQFASDIISFIICYLKHSGHFNQLQLIEIDLMKCATTDVNDEWFNIIFAYCNTLLCLCCAWDETKRTNEIEKAISQYYIKYKWLKWICKVFSMLVSPHFMSTELKCLREQTFYYN